MTARALLVFSEVCDRAVFALGCVIYLVIQILLIPIGWPVMWLIEFVHRLRVVARKCELPWMPTIGC